MLHYHLTASEPDPTGAPVEFLAATPAELDDVIADMADLGALYCWRECSCDLLGTGDAA